ncbi:MAG: hypothetical protein KJ623_00350 [Nanoarchaeota archaeon]|nr:hypothetical protein [Nanoarchaeota archaeon]MBU0962429.1 hypothetical protein [Nanoarchaeota archaeon]
MIFDETFLKKLRSAFNLNIYEVKIWTALLSKGVAAAGELSDISNVPRSRSYDVLESLEKRGFVVMKLGKPIKYLAVKPEEIFLREKKRLVEGAESQVKQLDNIEKTDLFKELQLLFTNGVEHVDPEKISGSIKGRSNVYNHLIAMINTSKKSINLMTTSAGLIRKYDKINEYLKKASKRGVAIRVVTAVTPENKSIVDELSKFAKIKNSVITSRFCTVDNEQVLFMTHDDKTIHEAYDNAIWVSSPYFVNSLNNMFANLWK